MFLSGAAICCPSKAFNHPKVQHCIIVLSFFISKFLLSTLDIVTDILTAWDFFNNGDKNWGLFTVLLIFAPFLARVIHTIIRIALCIKITKDSNLPICQRFWNEGRLNVLLKEMPSFLWNFPFFQPIRQGRSFQILTFYLKGYLQFVVMEVRMITYVDESHTACV